MGKVLVIAEKPDAGRNMAKVLKCDNCKDGYIENEKYIVTWAVGHLIGLKMPEEHNPALKEWKMSTLPLIFDIDDSLKVLPDTKKQFEIVKKLIHRPDVDYLINAGDAGREGYLIQSWIYRYAGNRKPVKILWANSLTDEALRHAFTNLKEEDIYFKNLLQEAEARAEADYLLGMNYSRVLTLTKSRDITLSYGRCQTPLLYLIVKRDQEIEQFVPENFYQLKIEYAAGFSGSCVSEDGKVFNISDPKEAEHYCQQCSGKNAQVVSFEREDKKKKAPLLFSLADLQKEMGKKYKYSPDHTLEILQVLYEKYKIVSYPRTDSSYLTLDLYNEITEHIKSCNFGKFAAAIEKIDLTSIRADKSYFNDAKVTDHHALILTINDTTKDKYDSLSVDEKNVFDAIVYRFLAIFYPPYEYGSTTLVTRIDDLYFRSRGISVKALGYKEILQEKDAADAENSIIPLLHTGETAEVKNVECVSKKTSPPPKYTVDSIITLMQKYGIGTSATMAEIVKKLQNPKRQSIVLENGVYSSTSFGRKFISVVPDELKSPELTKNIEEKLSQIGEGSLTKEDFLNDIIQDIRSYIDTVKGEADDLEKEIGICPECNTPVLEKRFEYACATPGCFKLGKVIKEKTISPNMVKDLLLHGQTGWIKGFHGKKGLYTAKIIYRKGKLEFEFPPQRQRG